jgi:hypothetical protein
MNLECLHVVTLSKQTAAFKWHALWRRLTSGQQRLETAVKLTDVSEVRAVSIMSRHPDDGVSIGVLKLLGALISRCDVWCSGIICICQSKGYCLHHSLSPWWWSTDLWNAGKRTVVFTALQPRRQPSAIFVVAAVRTSDDACALCRRHTLCSVLVSGGVGANAAIQHSHLDLLTRFSEDAERPCQSYQVIDVGSTAEGQNGWECEFDFYLLYWNIGEFCCKIMSGGLLQVSRDHQTNILN